MAKKRFTDIEIWDKEWFMELSPKLKCLVRYLFDSCDSSGVWCPNWKLATLHIGEKVSLEDLKLIPGDQWELINGGKIFLPGFISFQYGKLSDSCAAHKPIFRDIEKNNLSNRVFNRVSNTLQEKETEEEKEKEEDFGKSENLLIPSMLTAFKILFPKYPLEKGVDYAALKEIAVKIRDSEGMGGDIVENQEGILKRWGELVTHIRADGHLSKYSLAQVNKHFQSVIQSFTNGTHKQPTPKAKVGKSTGANNLLDHLRGEWQRPG